MVLVPMFAIVGLSDLIKFTRPVFFWYKAKLKVKRARDKVNFIKALPFISTKLQVNGLLTSHLAGPISGYQS